MSDDARTEQAEAILDRIFTPAWRQHEGGHTDAPNWKYFIPWADRQLKHTPPKS